MSGIYAPSCSCSKKWQDENKENLCWQRKTAWKKYITSTFNKELHMDKKMLFITYAGLTNDELKEITKEVRERMQSRTLFIKRHLRRLPLTAGPGTFRAVICKDG